MESEPSWASTAHQNQSGLGFPLFAHCLFGFSQAQVPVAAKAGQGGQTRAFERRVYASYVLPTSTRNTPNPHIS